MDELEEFTVARGIHGYHVYKDIWDATMGEELHCDRELDKSRDIYTAVVKGGVSLGHFPKR